MTRKADIATGFRLAGQLSGDPAALHDLLAVRSLNARCRRLWERYGCLTSGESALRARALAICQARGWTVNWSTGPVWTVRKANGEVILP